MAEDLSALSRDELNDRAEEAGVEDPEDLANKEAVIAAIQEAEGTSPEEDTGASDTGTALATSDAEAHVEGVAVGDVTTDTGDGPHSSDSPTYPFPTAGDVDVATVPDAPAAEGEEWHEPLTGGDVWVRLGATPDVPEENQGHIAVVIDSSTYETEDGTEALDEEKPIIVKVRDETSATLSLTISDISEISRNGRAGLVPFA